MTPSLHRRLLRAAVALAALVPVSAGLVGVMLGPAMLPGLEAVGAPADSHYRYLSGLLLGIGLAFWWMLPAIERQGKRFRLLGFVVVVGGVGRLIGLGVQGDPGLAGWLALGMELGVTPLLCLWQWHVERVSAA
ncbi:DUF4345 domain-containing protein [Pseudoroseomonas cervicalis]|uniref:DUF4345 domain-containing protein n=1 Tax=Pseudoroseomonas cervicalis ATCC 49957 TaxID=525371 RepID=D5RS35_9PROT|nr:DUF4345 domain-containing protein [Pseudoroseomonas cervicalis]EFH09879.1 hypothetical protein HMPREF0731_3897 [Pseudoroseomonas cervicalis ATCC 49957]